MLQRQQTDNLWHKIARELPAAVVVIGALAALKYSLGEPVPRSERIAALVGFSLLGYALIRFLILLIGWLVAKRIKPRVREEVLLQQGQRLMDEAAAAARQHLVELTGIVEIFPNFRVCQREIIEAIGGSQTVRVFLQLGRTVVGGATDFYDLLEQKTQPTADVKILHARMDSPYLSERVAHQRGSNYRGWLNELDHAVKTVTVLTDQREGRIEGRQHREGYVWRLFLTEDYAYVQPYLYDRRNSEQAPVLKIAKAYDGKDLAMSLYRVFSAYFDQKWDENVPTASRLEDLIPRGSACAVAGILKYHQFLIFAIPKRYIARLSSEVPFHGIGGKLRPPETLLDALRREAVEEIGVQIEIEPASRTRYFTTSAELEPVAIGDLPRPYCLYRKTRQQDPNFDHQDVLWLVGYEGKVLVDSLEYLRPGAEVGAVVIVTHETLRRTLVSDVSFNGIIAADDGSRVVVAADVTLDFSRRAVPSGVAALVASEHTGRVTYQP